MKAKGKVIFCNPTPAGPFPQYVQSMKESLPLIIAAGWEEGYVQIVGNPYISAARATMARTALDDLTMSKNPGEQRLIVFLDHDLSWDPQDLLTLIETEGDVVAGTYRCKIDEEMYMGVIQSGPDGCPLVRQTDGAISAKLIPAGFLKITEHGINEFMTAYPELCYGPKHHQAIDLFNHGAYQGIWWGEDYSFARRYKEKCGDIWTVPDLNLTHWERVIDQETGAVTYKPYPGNFHQWLMRESGGSPEKYEEFKRRISA